MLQHGGDVLQFLLELIRIRHNTLCLMEKCFVMAVLVLQKVMQTEMQILICVLVSWTK